MQVAAPVLTLNAHLQKRTCMHVDFRSRESRMTVDCLTYVRGLVTVLMAVVTDRTFLHLVSSRLGSIQY